MKQIHLAAAAMLALLVVACAEQEAPAPEPAAPEAPAAPVAAAPAAPEPEPAAHPDFWITNVTGNLYAAGTPSHSTAFLVTSDGVILADPVRPDFAEWLKGEIKSRFDADVKYVLYSHHHPDHAAGGYAFADTATYIGHTRMNELLSGPLPTNAVALDTDGSGTIEREEARGGYANNFDNTDTNGDGSITGEEIHAATHPLDMHYNESMQVTLGDSTVELYYASPSHTDDTTWLYFPEERAIFGVDYVHMNRLPGNLGGRPIETHLAALADFDEFEFDHVIQGHSAAGTRADLERYVAFLHELRDKVQAAIDAGQTVDEAVASVDLSAYSSYPQFEQRRENLIRETYGVITEG